MNNDTFLKATVDEKIEELIRRCRESMNKNGLERCFYAFDTNGNMRVIEIKEPSLFKAGRERILKPIVKEKIQVLERDAKIKIDKLMYIREGLFNKNVDTEELHLELDFNAGDDNEALIITIESKFEFNAIIYDLIRGEDQGQKYCVMSKDPIAKIETNKMDPDVDLGSYFKNIMS